MTAVKKVGRPPNQERIAQRKAEILETATSVFADKGYRNTDVQTIADAIGVGKGTVYRYFPSKQELFFAAVDRGMTNFLEELANEADKHTEPLDRLAAVVHAYLNYFQVHPDLVELLIQERAEFRDREKASYFLYCDERVGRWHDAFRRILATGQCRDLLPDTMFDVISNLLYGTMFTNFFTGNEKSCEAQAKKILDIFYNGILKKERPVAE